MLGQLQFHLSNLVMCVPGRHYKQYVVDNLLDEKYRRARKLSELIFLQIQTSENSLTKIET